MAEDVVELTLNSKQVAEIALYMYGEYKKCPSLKYAYVDFDVWLNRVIAKATMQESNPPEETNGSNPLQT